jgi:acyl carrier protein
MIMSPIEQRITEMLATQFKVDRAAIGADVTFGSLHFDSLVLIELRILLDDAFGIVLDPEDLTEGLTIGDAAALVAAKGAVPR